MTLAELDNYWVSFNILHSSVEEVKDEEYILHLAHPGWEYLRNNKKTVYAPFKCEGWKVIVW